LFEYVSQIRIHYWTSPEAKRLANGHRDPVVGRRLPWTGGNYGVLRDPRWQIHVYGGLPASEVAGLGLPVHVFDAAPGTRLQPGHFYLVRSDGFVAAEATPSDAPKIFADALPR
jgi:hypothetical protein